MAERPDHVTRIDQTPSTQDGVGRRRIDNGEHDQTSDHIRADIDRTRAHMDQTVDELKGRLTLDHFARSALEFVRDGAGSAVTKVGGIIRENPLASVVIAGGIIWMLMGRTSRRRNIDMNFNPEEAEYDGTFEGYVAHARSTAPSLTGKTSRAGRRAAKTLGDLGRGIRDTATDVSTGVKNQVSESFQNAGSAIGEKYKNIGRRMAHTAEDIGGYARDTASAIGQHVQHGAQRGSEWFVDTVEDKPLAVGAAFFALGLAGGMSMPSSRKEDQLLGSVRDELLDRAQSAGAQLIRRGEQVAERVATCAKESMTDAAQDAQAILVDAEQ